MDTVNCGDKETRMVITVGNRSERGTVIFQEVQAKSIRVAGEEFHSELLRHFENDHPDVLELELEAEEQK